MASVGERGRSYSYAAEHETGLDLRLEVIEEGADPEELDASTRSLRRELGEIDGLAAATVAADGAPGAKGDVDLLATIAVSMASSAMPALVTMLGRWVQERNRCMVKVTKGDGTSLEIPHQLDRDQIEKIVATLLAE
jgi:hypothetical protein